MDYKEYFKGKKINIMGLGLLGRGLGDAIFLHKMGAKLTITDLKTKKELKDSIDKLKKCKGVKYILGKHRIEDFVKQDLIIKGPNIPFSSKYIVAAQRAGVEIETDESLFIKFLPRTVVVIGVTGTRGKSTTTHLIHHILKNSFKDKNVFLGGNIKGVATLPLIEKVGLKDVVVLELSSWQLQLFKKMRYSPSISVFTNFMPDHLNYYKTMHMYFKDKSYVYKYQGKGDFLVTTRKMFRVIKSKESSCGKVKSKIISPESIEKYRRWNLKIVGDHNLENISLAVSVAKIVGIPMKNIKKEVESFGGISGRLYLMKKVRGVYVYNDNNATTPEATVAALKALSKEGRIVLIVGGTNKGLDVSSLAQEIQRSCKAVVLFKETGTEILKKKLAKSRKIDILEADGLANCLRLAFSLCQKGDILLYSPAFASFGKYFRNEFDREEQFVKLVSKLK